jgi:hypothetical protein
MKLAAVALAFAAFAADRPPSASELLERAKAEAASGGRAIWVVFGASW